MQKTIVTILIMLFVVVATAQIKEVTLTENQKIGINKMFTNYLKDLQKEEKDWNRIIQYTYPTFFLFMSEESIIEQLKKAFRNEIFYTTFDEMKLEEIKESFSFNDVIYSKTTYKSVMVFHFIKAKKQSEKEFKEYLDFMHEIFKNKYKEFQVTKKDNDIIFTGNKIILAIYDKKIATWKMLEYIKDSQDYYKMFLPNEVAENIK